MAHLEVQNFIGNEFVNNSSNSRLQSYEPAVGCIWATLPDSDPSDVAKAVQAAKHAFPGWKKSPPASRSKVMMKIADILESKLDKFAVAESRDNGKPVSLAKAVDIPRAVYNFRFFATSILHSENKASQLEAMNAINYTTRTPLGVAGLISPWNLPLYLLTWKIAPCIAFGNTCVCKPSEITSVTAYMLCQVFLDAGLPAGVVNMVFGLGNKVGEAIVTHPDVPLISFTGSTAVGKRIQRLSGEMCKKVSLELGGKNPGIIFADTDLDKALPMIVRSCFANQGEICLCMERLFVQREIFDEFLLKFVEAARKWKVGDPQEPGVNMGALVSKEHLNKVTGCVKQAIDLGAQVHCGHSVDKLDLPDKNKAGYFFLPTVLTGLADDSPINQSEIFGPVVHISPFDTEQEVIERANNVNFGLAAMLYTRDSGRLHRVAQSLEVGTVWCNCWMIRDLRMPFGGFKMSGVGRESQEESYEFFTEHKTICISMDM